MPYQRLLSLVLLCAAALRPVAATCYYRNGTATSSDYSPCSPDSSNPLHTVCCATWDNCLPNGLCQSFDKVIWRESCTKQNWDEGGCQEICSKERDAQRNDNIKVTPCSGNSSSLEWCCGTSNDCCSPDSVIPRYTIARRFGDPIPSPTASSAVSSSTTSNSPTSSINTSVASPDGLSAGAKAGIGVGVAVGIIALIALGIFAWKAMQWRKAARAAAPPYELHQEQSYQEAERADVYQYRSDHKPVAQLAGHESEVHEIADSRDPLGPHQLPSRP